MPFVGDFSASQTVGLPSIITLTDESTGSDPAISTRRVYFTTGYNTFLTPSGSATDYILWPLSNSSQNFDVLDKDYSLNIVVFYVNSSGSTLYTASHMYGFTLYNEQFLYDLTQSQTAEYQIIQDQSYYVNKETMRVEVDSGNQAITLASDIAGAQSCYDRATNYRTNQQFYF